MHGKEFEITHNSTTVLSYEEWDSSSEKDDISFNYVEKMLSVAIFKISGIEKY